MKQSKIHIQEPDRPVSGFKTGVSLHSHTLHSQETLAFIDKLADRSHACRIWLEHGRTQYKKAHGTALDLNRGWWTPPLAPYDAWSLERRHIENLLDRRALVSLTDHDDIEAPLALRVLQPCRHLPVSVEWTVPYGPAFFHLGVHNLPPDRARCIMARMQAFTVSGRTSDLAELLSSLAASRDTLIVFNHPCWDESVIGQEAHMQWATQFIKHYGENLHALELNGLRPWAENREVIKLGFACEKPLISGGDRHAVEPNTILDLTDAPTFSEYVEQVRSGWTNVFVTHQYSEPFKFRILQSLQEVMAYREDHGRGWKRWSDRVFYRCEDGVVRSLTTLFGEKAPAPVRLVAAVVGLSRHRRLRQSFRVAFPKRQEVAL